MWSSASTPGDLGTRIRGGSGTDSGVTSGTRLEDNRRSLRAVGRRVRGRRLGRLAPSASLRAGSAGAVGLCFPRLRGCRSGVDLVGLGLAGLAPHDLERPLELRAVDRDQLLDLAQHVGQRLEVHLVALPQLELQLGEPLGDLRADEDLDVVDGHLDHRAVARVVPLLADLAERDEVTQRALADDLDDGVPGLRGGPRGRGLRGIGRTFQLLAPVRRAAVVVAREALEREDRALARRTEATGIARGLEGAVLGVEVPVLVADRLGRSGRGEPRELVGRQQALTGRHVGHPVLELDFHRPPLQQSGHARGSIDPAAPTPEWWE